MPYAVEVEEIQNRNKKNSDKFICTFVTDENPHPSEMNTMLKSKVTFYHYCGNNELPKADSEANQNKKNSTREITHIAHIVSYLVPCSVVYCIHFKLIKKKNGKRSTRSNTHNID